MIGTPMYGGQCYSGFVESLLLLQNKLMVNGAEFHFINIVNESLITRARNHIANVFLSSNCDFLLFIDGDHRFDPDAIIRMIEEDDDILCGIAPKKSINWGTVKEAAVLGAQDLRFFTGDFVINFLDKEVNLAEKFEIKHGGTGLMLIKRVVFEKLKNLVPQYRCPISKDKVMVSEFFTTTIENDELLSEDYEFCRLWRSLDGKVYAAPWVGMTHIGNYEFSGNFYAHLDLYKRMSIQNKK